MEASAIKERVALTQLVERDLGPPKKQSGGRLSWLCPFHGETVPSFVVFPDGGFKCYGCSESGDVFNYIMLRDGVTFVEAKATLLTLISGGVIAAERPKQQPAASMVKGPPDEQWQQAAGAVMLDCAFDLEAEGGAAARAWLLERGLNPSTLADWFIGFNNAGRSHGKRKRHGLQVYHGIVIPHYHRSTGDVWALKIRRSVGEPRYINVEGSRPHLWGLDNLADHDVAFVCEGEFDGLLLWQEVNDLVGVVAQGAAANHNIDRWLPHLLHVKRLYIATDNDRAGQDAAEYWMSRTKRARRVLPPLEQLDLTDSWKAGADLRQWVLDILEN